MSRESLSQRPGTVAKNPIHPPLGYRAFHALLDATGVSREDERNLSARAVRWSVIQGVRVLRRVRSLEFPSRGTGGWWWLWRWKFEFLMNWFEWQSLGWARRLIRPGMTVIDLGAHVGYYSRFLSRLVGPKGRVYAFEASPENQAVLRRNLASPRYSNVEVVPSAISDHEGTMKLFVSPGHSNHSLIPGFTPADDVLEIPTISVDEFTKQRGIRAIDFIKMDIEGAETMALNGMRETIRKSPQLVLLAECNPLALRTAGTTAGEFLQLIEDVGLKPSAILDDATLGPLPDVASIEASISLYINLLCVKPDETLAVQRTADRRAVEAQIRGLAAPPYKLNIGCGRIRFDGWINLDSDPSISTPDVVWDLGLGFPVPDASCGLIYSEHLLEHMKVEDGVALLRECRRVLAPGGRLRFAMPSLDFLLEKVCSGNWRDQDWLTWPDYQFIQTRAEMLNMAFHWWGHQWLYDREEFHRRLKEAGFTRLLDVAWGESEVVELRGRETRKDSLLICEAMA